MEPLKEMFNLGFYENLALELNKSDKHFHPAKFVNEVTRNMDALSLNQRMRNTSLVMKKYLPADFHKSIAIMKNTVPNLPKGYTLLIFPDYTGLYGLDDFEASTEALAFFTQYGSSEFAIREFLKRDFSKTIKVMEKWAGDKNEHVRRLASEGSRPRLPWSFKLDEVIKNPGATAKILDKLKADKALYVRKSVANHLNDFSREHPTYLLNVVSAWDRTNPHTAWIVKHACRTLIKKGHAETLGLFDFNHKADVEITNFETNSVKLRLGETLTFQFDIISQSKKPQKLVVDYCIHYYKKTSVLLPKVFKLKEIMLEPGARIAVIKKQTFVDFTTRKHYAGKHILEVLINGKVLGRKEFELLT